MATRNIASIDLGSNSCRLRIADDKGNVIYHASKATMLAEGLFETGSLTQKAINRAIDALSEFSLFLDLYEVCSYRAVTTAACRSAKNGVSFVKRVKEETGIVLEIIDTYEEARLNLKGALLNAPKENKYAVVYDLGGASTEITLAKNDGSNTILHTVSIPWGARNAAEAYHLEEFDQTQSLKLEKDIQTYVRNFIKDSNFEKYGKESCLIATSSTPLRLCSMVCKDQKYSREKNDGKTLETQDIDQVIQQICCMNLEQRAQSIYIGENRASVFIAACIIFKTIYQEFGFNNLIVSYKSAQDAMLKELIQDGKTN